MCHVLLNSIQSYAVNSFIHERHHYHNRAALKSA
jgi:hypothetical protein